jgi:hypothetical protein
MRGLGCCGLLNRGASWAEEQLTVTALSRGLEIQAHRRCSP